LPRLDVLRALPLGTPGTLGIPAARLIVSLQREADDVRFACLLGHAVDPRVLGFKTGGSEGIPLREPRFFT
jgi:hypothetical protein